MNELTIWPIHVGTISRIEKSNLTYGIDQGVKVDVPSIIYVVKGGPELIVVDTGMSNAEWATKYHHPSTRTPSQEPLQAFLNAGLDPDEVKIVILTHLHWDHCSNNSLFKNAKLFIQRDEVNYALFPLPIHTIFYESLLIGMNPPWLNDIQRLEIIEGDKEIFGGLKILKIPSHSPGFQGVNVKTKKGNYFIGSDFCPLLENWKGEWRSSIPSGIHVDLADYYQSFKKVEGLTDFVLPGHDLRIFNQVFYP